MRTSTSFSLKRTTSSGRSTGRTSIPIRCRALPTHPTRTGRRCRRTTRPPRRCPPIRRSPANSASFTWREPATSTCSRSMTRRTAICWACGKSSRRTRRRKTVRRARRGRIPRTQKVPAIPGTSGNCRLSRPHSRTHWKRSISRRPREFAWRPTRRPPRCPVRGRARAFPWRSGPRPSRTPIRGATNGCGRSLTRTWPTRPPPATRSRFPSRPGSTNGTRS